VTGGPGTAGGGAIAEVRARLQADPALAGRALCRAHSDAIDEWLGHLLRDAVGDGSPEGVALLAVGGYGRAELSLQSDVDVVLLHAGRADIGALADRVWYPIWDAGVKLGHAVRTPKEALSLAADDLDTATSLLTVRHLGGDRGLTDALAADAAQQWRKRSKRWLAELSRRTASRHERAGEVAFLLEPDLKEGRGGLRDVHALRWAEAARNLLWEGDSRALDDAYDVLLSTRVELHRRTGRPGDRLLLQEQDSVAEALGHASADDLMRAVAGAARTIAWRSDDAWARIDASLAGPLGRLVRRDRSLGEGLVLREGEVHLTATADPSADSSLALRAGAAAARHDTRLHRSALDRLGADAPAPAEPWPGAVRSALVDLLLAGRPAIGVIEALDQVGVWTRHLPEWDPTRSKPQRNAYHRFTVDRHLVEAAAGAAELAGRVRRPDLLVVGALLHDIGKGYPGDHTDVGVELLEAMGPRLGFGADDVATLQALVRHHLLLPDVATRRDLDDPATITAVADAVGDLVTLELLAALTEADSIATGPAAWGTWKAELVRELVARAAHVLGGGQPEEVQADFPSEEHLGLLAAREQVVLGEGDRLTVVCADRPGLFSQVAGVLALHGLDVLEAAATSVEGWALEVFRVESSFGPTFSWDRALTDLELALAGRLALGARLAERVRVYGGDRGPRPAPVAPRVRFVDDASESCTVIEVHSPDGIGVLHRITKALAELSLDIASAKVQTMGPEVVDTFYVRDPAGGKLDDPVVLVELERSLLHELSRPG
jgi:[protein-PII] uridylyltransferase